MRRMPAHLFMEGGRGGPGLLCAAPVTRPFDPPGHYWLLLVRTWALLCYTNYINDLS